ncbi:alpha/beta fold hydrolase [Krasilnikovia sp. MM14-A1004]|uniref:alpha/beta hydrolase n=1 Tax=Krasilnikovia sp. MM14-A1004 TaxID=3373541 RepID=UPI00399D198C
MQTLTFRVSGGDLTALRFGTGPRLVLAVHGITASGMQFRAVARHLPADWSLLALDLRGRGGSDTMPGPYGIDAHAADVCAVARQLAAPVVLTGHSMGAYVALRAAVTAPGLVDRLVLIDGGLPLPAPTGVDPDQVLHAAVGPALARLRLTFDSLDSYLAHFRAHPALSAHWNDDLDAYVRYDATGVPGAIRSRVNADAVGTDGRDVIARAASFGDDLLRWAVPSSLLYAPRDALDREPGMLPEPVVAHWVGATRLQAELVPGTNHYTIVLADGPAQIIADRLTACTDEARTP